MGADDESVFPLRQWHRQLVASFSCQFRRDLSRLKGLTQMDIKREFLVLGLLHMKNGNNYVYAIILIKRDEQRLFEK